MYFYFYLVIYVKSFIYLWFSASVGRRCKCFVLQTDEFFTVQNICYIPAERVCLESTRFICPNLFQTLNNQRRASTTFFYQWQYRPHSFPLPSGLDCQQQHDWIICLSWSFCSFNHFTGRKKETSLQFTSVHCDGSILSQPGAQLPDRTYNQFNMSAFLYTFSLHSPKVSCSGLHQNWAFTGIVWQLTRACSATRQFDSFFGFVLGTSSRSTRPVCSRRKETHFISLSPLRAASLDQQRLFSFCLVLTHSGSIARNFESNRTEGKKWE